MNQSCCPPQQENDRYDLAVIGAGSAGFSAAITAAEQGAQVALIGHGTIGGTCVNVGCVPSKALIRATEAVHHAKSASRFAGVVGNGQVKDWIALRAQKDELVTSLRQAKYIDLLPAYNGVAYFEGQAKLGNGGVTVDDLHIDADKVIVATGSREFVPNIPGIENVPFLTSTTAFEMERLPASMIVMGGGYIGCELAQMFARAGVKVTMVFRSRLLPGGEPEISEALAQYFDQEGISVRQVSAYERISHTDNGVILEAQIDGKTHKLEAEHFLLAAGRTANTEGLGLDEAGIEILPNGGINVDEQMRTTKAGVYAAGDVTGRDQFVYMAAYGAKIAANNAMNGDSRNYDNNAMPAVTFTDPQVASVGRTEAAARAQGIDVKTSVLPLDNVPRALAARDTRGLIKLVADSATSKLIGAHIIAPEGADSIQTAAIAIKQGMTYGELGEMIFPYLTTVEGLKLAAQTFDMDVSKLSCCAG
ncbi:MAG: mercury(II) reductase [Geminicoccales bacterium]